MYLHIRCSFSNRYYNTPSKKSQYYPPPKYFLSFLFRIDDLYVDICTSIMQIGVIDNR